MDICVFSHFSLSVSPEICIVLIFLKNQISSGWCGSVGWALSYGPKGCGFDSRSGHTPGLQIQFQLGAYEKQLISVSLSHRCFCPSLSPSLPLSLKSITMYLGEDKKKIIKLGFIYSLYGFFVLCSINMHSLLTLLYLVSFCHSCLTF